MEPRYLHGYRPEEEGRLHHQAQFLAGRVHDRLPFAGCRRLLEVGCGVGGQSAILLRSFPSLHLTGIDRSESQTAAARRALAADPDLTARSEFVSMDAHDLAFGAGAFDGAFLCWVLEHLRHPRRALEELRRVLTPGAPVVCNEVLGSSLWHDPHGPDLASFWRAYMDHQTALGGDPFVGAKLGDLLSSTGFRDVATEVKAIHLDRRAPDDRAAVAAYTVDLLLSATPAMLEAGRVTPGLVDGMRRDLERVGSDEHGVFFYTFIQATARA
jgi:SAM-dependent methyltransferase